MTKRYEQLYVDLFTYLRDNHNLNPQHFMADFECASRNAAKIVVTSK